MAKSGFFDSKKTNPEELLVPVFTGNVGQKNLATEIWEKEDKTLCSEVIFILKLFFLLCIATECFIKFKTFLLLFFKNLLRNVRPKFLCHQEERKRKAEIKKSRIIQKLKINYQINVEGLQENVANEIIQKVEAMEKKKKEMEKKDMERNLQIVTKLLEEQKYKRRGKKNNYELKLTFVAR